MQSQLEIITPAVAQALLSRNTHNRPISQRTLQRYTDDITNGRWKQNGATIVISEDGTIMDGQHRLTAIIRANQPLAVFVVRGVSTEAFDTIDNGKSRATADILALGGHACVSQLAAAGRAAYVYVGGASFNFAFGRVELTDFITRHPYLATVTSAVTARVRRFPKGVLAAVLFLGNERRNMDDEVAAFIDGVATGESLQRGDARLTLREWEAAERVRARGNVHSRAAFAAAARAWNAYASGKPLTVIKALKATSRTDLPIFGYDPSLYDDVPNHSETPPARGPRGRFASVRAA